MLYDISVPINADLPVYPGDPPLALRRVLDVAAGDPYSLSALALGVHLGTHVDAPAHYFAAGLTIERVALAALVGPAQVVDLTGRPWPGPAITVPDLLGAGLADGVERVLLKTRNSELWRRYPGVFAPAWLGLAADAAAWLVTRGVRLVGIDYMSIEPPDAADFATHQTLLRAGTLILEGLDLGAVPPGHYDLTALPLRLDGAEAAPARAVLRPSRPGPGTEFTGWTHKVPSGLGTGVAVSSSRLSPEGTLSIQPGTSVPGPARPLRQTADRGDGRGVVSWTHPVASQGLACRRLRYRP